MKGKCPKKYNSKRKLLKYALISYLDNKKVVYDKEFLIECIINNNKISYRDKYKCIKRIKNIKHFRRANLNDYEVIVILKAANLNYK